MADRRRVFLKLFDVVCDERYKKDDIYIFKFKTRAGNVIEVKVFEKKVDRPHIPVFFDDDGIPSILSILLKRWNYDNYTRNIYCLVTYDCAELRHHNNTYKLYPKFAADFDIHEISLATKENMNIYHTDTYCCGIQL